MEDKFRIVVTDDKEKFRQYVREILQPYPVEIVGEAADGKQLMGLLSKQMPDIILLDLEMPVMDGNKTFDLLCQNFPEIKVIIVSLYAEGILIEDYLERGASGYIPKDHVLPALLMKAIKTVMKGETFVYPKPRNSKNFSTRQKQILPLIFEGKTSSEIASEVLISKRAVEKQRTKIYEKSGVDKMIDFYKYAFTRGLHFLGKRSQGQPEKKNQQTVKV